MDRLFGLETEYALSCVDARGRAVDRLRVLRRMLDLVGERLPVVPDNTGQGVFLSSAARLYIDAPDHPEYATPEVTNPWDAVRYQRAGDRLVGELAAAAAAEDPTMAGVNVLRCNVDYSGNLSTWGQHESHLHTCDPEILPSQLLPHLVSRIIYTGAGGFDSLRSFGVYFTLSPRTWHLSRPVSDQSQHDRGIYHTKRESLASGGYHRLHIIAGESLVSDTAAWLKVATTAVVVAMIDGGVRPGDRVGIPKPVDAMRSFAADPTCTARCVVIDGTPMRALDIQRHYLQLAERNAGAGFMPPWTDEVCRRWRAILDQLEGGAAAVATTLDWGIKLALYGRHIETRGMTWESLRAWSAAVERQRATTGDRQQSLLDLLRPRSAPAQPQEPTVARRSPELRRFNALRNELFELDARFAQLGETGIFAMLDRAGVLTHAVPGVDNIEHALEYPPASGRAHLRGNLIRQLGTDGRRKLSCDWAAILDWEGRRAIDLRDPFATRAAWGQWIATGLAYPRFAAQMDGMMGSEPFEVPDTRDRLEALVAARLEELRAAEARHGPEHTDTALAHNQLGVALRVAGRPAEAEPHQRRAFAIDLAVRGENDPKVPHRLNNLAVVLVMQGKLAEACELLQRAWSLKSAAHDLISARILWTRTAAGVAAGAPYGVLLGLMKSLLAAEQRIAGDISGHWSIRSAVYALGNHVTGADARFLVRLGETLNDWDTRRLRPFTRWRTQSPLPLEAEWPQPVADPARWLPVPVPPPRTRSVRAFAGDSAEIPY